MSCQSGLIKFSWHLFNGFNLIIHFFTDPPFLKSGKPPLPLTRLTKRSFIILTKNQLEVNCVLIWPLVQKKTFWKVITGFEMRFPLVRFFQLQRKKLVWLFCQASAIFANNCNRTNLEIVGLAKIVSSLIFCCSHLSLSLTLSLTLFLPLYLFLSFASSYLYLSHLTSSCQHNAAHDLFDSFSLSSLSLRQLFLTLPLAFTHTSLFSPLSNSCSCNYPLYFLFLSEIIILNLLESLTP